MPRNKKGVALPLVAVMLTTLLGIGALVIDLAEGYSLKTRIKNAVDLSVLAGVSQLTDTSSQSITNAKDTALSLLNSNLTMSIVGFSTLNLSSAGLSIQTGVYDSSTMTFTATESSSSINALKVSYTHTAMTTLGSIFMINTLDISDNTIASKQIAGQIAPGSGFPLAIYTTTLTSALSNSNMVDLYSAGTMDNSFWTVYTDSNPSTTDINNLVDYFQYGTGVKPPAVTVNNSFAINDGGMGGVFMNLNSSILLNMIYLFTVIEDNATTTAMAQGFVAGTINSIVNSMGDRYIGITIIPGYIDNTYGGSGIGTGVGSVGSSEQALLTNSFGLVN